MPKEAGYILRISKESWVTQVFDTAVYYTALPRSWKPGQVVLFLHKTNVGDAFIGYGLVGKTHEVGELSEAEQLECERYGWHKAIEFKYVVKFERPLPVAETFLRDSGTRGRYLHGLKLDSERVSSVIDQAQCKQQA